MTRPTRAEGARYRDGLTNGRWRFISAGIRQQLLAEIDALLAENDVLRAELAEAWERAGSKLSSEQLDHSRRFILKHCDRG